MGLVVGLGLGCILALLSLSTLGPNVLTTMGVLAVLFGALLRLPFLEYRAGKRPFVRTDDDAGIK